MKNLSLFLLLFLPLLSFAQTDPLSKDSTKIESIFDRVDQGAQPAEGIVVFNEYIQKRLQERAKIRELKSSEMVFIQFVVDEEGNLGEFKIVKSLGTALDEEVLRVFQTCDKKWKAGKQNGKNVKQRIVMPVKYEVR